MQGMPETTACRGPVQEPLLSGITTEEILAAIRAPCDGLKPVIGYALGTPGKRLRSALVYGSARLLGCPQSPNLARSAALVELLHNGTLLHDDVMDHARIRRNRPSVNRLWGDAVAILAGDFLLATVVDLALETAIPSVVATAVDTLIELVEGQMLEIQHQGDVDLQEETYLRIIEKKTGSLMGAACKIGASVARGASQQICSLARFGLDLGLAFQMLDDVRDYTASAETSGKDPGRDLAEGKVTLPFIASLRKADPSQRARLREVFSHPARACTLDELRGLLDRLGGFPYTLRAARKSVERAIASLSPFPISPARSHLEEIALQVLAGFQAPSITDTGR